MQPSTPLWQAERPALLEGHYLHPDCATCTAEKSCDRCYRTVSDRWFESGGLPTWRRYENESLATFQWSLLPPRVAQHIQGYATLLPQHLAEGHGLLLCGGPGSGKTDLAVGLGILAVGLGYRVYATTFAQWLLDIRNAWNQDPSDEFLLLERIQAADLLILDDLGMERPTGWAQERLAHLMDRRYQDVGATLVTSNLPPQQLASIWGGPLMSRLYNTTTALSFFPVDDYRRRGRPDAHSAWPGTEATVVVAEGEEDSLCSPAGGRQQAAGGDSLCSSADGRQQAAGSNRAGSE